MSRKGCPNRNKQFLLNRLKAMYGEDFNPILKMVQQAQRLHELSEVNQDAASIKASLEAWDRVASYVEPKLKPIDIDSQVSNSVTPIQIEIVNPAQ